MNPYWGMVDGQDPENWASLWVALFHCLMTDLLLWLGMFSFISLCMLWGGTSYSRAFTHHMELEVFYTSAPIVILMGTGYLSLQLLFVMEDTKAGYDMTMKVMGHQWYWSYEYSDMETLMYDSFMEWKMGCFYLFNSDTHLIVPNLCSLRLILTSDDVLHAWTIPSYALKIDVVPGRLNSLYFFTQYVGIYFGQCSEICGVNHSLMATGMEVIPMKEFVTWLKS